MVDLIQAKKKSKVYKVEMCKWEKRIQRTCILLSVIAIGTSLFLFIKEGNLDSLISYSNIHLKIFSSLPFAVYLRFCFKEYSINRKHYNFYNYNASLKINKSEISNSKDNAA